MKAICYRTVALILLVPIMLLFLPAAFGIILERIVRSMCNYAQRLHKAADAINSKEG